MDTGFLREWSKTFSAEFQTCYLDYFDLSLLVVCLHTNYLVIFFVVIIVCTHNKNS